MIGPGSDKKWNGLGDWVTGCGYPLDCYDYCGARIIYMFPISIDPRSDHWPAQVLNSMYVQRISHCVCETWMFSHFHMNYPENNVPWKISWQCFYTPWRKGGRPRGGSVFNNLTQPRLNRVTPPLLITSPLTSCHLAFVIIPQLLSLRKNTIKAGGSTAICKMWTGLEWSGYPLDCYDY